VAKLLAFCYSRFKGEVRARKPPMLTAEDNKVLRQSGAGTPMGELLSVLATCAAV
jgi:hypothetical protein